MDRRETRRSRPGGERWLRPAGTKPSLWQRFFVLAVGFVGVTVLAFVWVIVPVGGRQLQQAPTHNDGARPRAKTPPANPTTPAGGSPVITPGTGAGLTSAPTDVTWRLYDSVALPYSASAGPRVVKRSVVSGFAHTPEGALVALVQIAVRHLLAPDWQAVVATDVATGQGGPAYVALRTKAEEASQMPAVPGHYLQIAGFSFVSYSSTAAEVNIVSRATTGAMQVVTEAVVWQHGDWKLLLDAAGSAAPVAEPVQSLAGYVEWQGV